jgi:hypothetical protein
MLNICLSIFWCIDKISGHVDVSYTADSGSSAIGRTKSINDQEFEWLNSPVAGTG